MNREMVARSLLYNHTMVGYKANEATRLILFLKEREKRLQLPPCVFTGKEVINMAKDPVCGMEVDEKKATVTTEYQGKYIYFCAKACREVFLKNPGKYTGQKPPSSMGHMHGHWAHNRG